MIKVEKMSYSFPGKDLYHNISFTIEEGEHAALIGSNGSGKTTLIDMLINEEEYLYTGKIKIPQNLKFGYVSQFVAHDKELTSNVYDYICQDFLDMLAEQEAICLEMETATDFDEIMDRYQKSLDAFAAVDGDNYETNVHKQLKLAGLTHLENVPVSSISGGEYKLVQIIRQMMRFPGILIMDEPDVFLDFDNLAGLRNLILSYPGTILVITHNRFILNHCFNKILHLENADLQEFEGSYMDYQVALLSKKVELQEGAAKDLEEIERQEKLVKRMRKEATYIDNSAKGRQLNARVSLLERLKAKAIKAPFVEVREPEIHLYDKAKRNIPEQTEPVMDGSISEQTESVMDGSIPEQTESVMNGNVPEQIEPVMSENLAEQTIETVPNERLENLAEQTTETAPDERLDNITDFSSENKLNEKVENIENSEEKSYVLRVEDYNLAFDQVLLEHVTFDLGPHDKVALVGPNGTGKTTMLHDIYEAQKKECKIGYMSQVYTELYDEKDSVYDAFEPYGFYNVGMVQDYLKNYCFSKDMAEQRISTLSGGERNLLQLALLNQTNEDVLLLDEPTSHLDLPAQLALEKAIREYPGAVLMVSHDFYTIANCVDYVLYVDEKTVRRMSGRAFRKMIYKKHFTSTYIELERQKQELEQKINTLLRENDYESAKTLCQKLAAVVDQM